MVSLRTLVLSFDGRMAPVGQFLHQPDWPDWSRTLDAEGTIATIVGATLVDADDLGQQALCVVINNREKAPLICDEGTKLLSLDREEWVPASALSHGEMVRIPDVSAAVGLVPTWARVRKVMRAPLPDRLWLDQNRMWGRMVLKRGAWSYPTPAAWVHV